MITLGPRRLWLYGQPVDMRKGIDGLKTLVTTHLGREVLTGDMFLFVGPARPALCWDDGFWLATNGCPRADSRCHVAVTARAGPPSS
jgi:hypothetical protein